MKVLVKGSQLPARFTFIQKVIQLHPKQSQLSQEEPEESCDLVNPEHKRGSPVPAPGAPGALRNSELNSTRSGIYAS